MIMRSFLNAILAGIVAGIVITAVVIVFIIVWKDIVAPEYFQSSKVNVLNPAQVKELSTGQEKYFYSYLFKNAGGLRNILVMFGISIFLGIVWGLAYLYLRKSLPAHWSLAGLVFGLFVWLLGEFPVWLMIAFNTQFPRNVLGGWALGGIVSTLFGGLALGFIFALLEKESEAWRREKARAKQEKAKPEKKADEKGSTN
jgi:hypothetical protein